MTSWTTTEVTEQLARILVSREFVDSPKLCDFLTFVVDQALEGRSGKIKQYEIAVDGLGYDSDFDPASNPSVRIMARRVRRTLDLYYVKSGSTDPIRIKLPKGGYVPSFEKNQIQPSAPESDESVFPPELRLRELDEPSIAVLELEPLAHGDKDSMFAVGLTSELMVALSRFAGITILGPFSPASNPPLQWSSVQRDYGALFLLKGWIQTQGNLVRITSELIETETGQSRWAQSFDYDLEATSLFDIQSEIAGLVSGAVADDLGTVFRYIDAGNYSKHTRFGESTKAILAYNRAWQTHFPDDWRQAYIEVGEALAKDPENALLNALQANVHYADLVHGLSCDPKSLDKMQSLSAKAIALDPTLDVAQYNLVVMNALFGRVEACVRAAHKAVAMNPNHARMLAGSALAVTSVGEYELGQELIERAKKLNPQYPSLYLVVDFLVHFQNERYEKAWECAQLIRTPGLRWELIIRAAALGKLNRSKDAKPYLDELLKIEPHFLERPQQIIRTAFVTDDHVNTIWDGLQRAGIEQSGSI